MHSSMITSIPESARGVAANARKGGVGDSRAPLSARSAASSVVSTNVNSQSYLNNREYNFLYAKSVWLQRVQGERTGCEGEEAVLKVGTYFRPTAVFDQLCTDLTEKFVIPLLFLV